MERIVPADRTLISPADGVAADIVVIGAGPAGVAAACAGLDAGLSVVLVDGGGPGVEAVPDRGLVEVRSRDPEQWRALVGTDFHALRGDGAATPKLRAPTIRHVFANYADAYGLREDDFLALGSLSGGGLSNAWGAGVACYDADDLAGFPVALAELESSYRTVAGRIGISGCVEPDDAMAAFFGTAVDVQPAPDLNGNARRLLARYGRRPPPGLRLGRSRNAILTRNHAGRQGCNRCGWCLWGCNRKSIYSARHDLERLHGRAGFRYIGDAFIERVLPRSEDEGMCRAVGRVRSTGSALVVRGARILVASGAIGTGRIVHESLGRRGRPIPLLTTPAVGFALWMPERFGAAAEPQPFGLAQLSFRLTDPERADGYVFGNIFGTDALPASELVRHVPLSRPAAIRLIRGLMPSLLVANLFMPSDHGAHRLEIRADGGIDVVGRYDEDGFSAKLARVRKGLARAFRGCGAVMLPGSYKPTIPGADVHYGGTVPMRSAPQVGEAWPDGRVEGLPGVHVVDAAAFPRLPAKPHTFTMMANADRITRLVARSLANGDASQPASPAPIP